MNKTKITLLAFLFVLMIMPSSVFAKQVLQQSDFTYIGSFLLPKSVGAGDPPWGKGMAFRYVNGEPHIFSSTWNPQMVFEVKVPTLSTNEASIPTAPLYKLWGDIFHGKKLSTSGGSELFGLFWDETDKRLYWNFQNSYNASIADDESVGYSTLNDVDGSSMAYGPWKFTGRGAKATDTCMTNIPQWFADLYTGGKRLGAGCGGNQSVLAVGPASLGPALTAFQVPNVNTNPERSSLAYTNLVGYPYNGQPYTTPDRAHRDTNYTNEFDGWNPRNGVGYWSWTDFMYGQSGIWVDTANKSGMMYFPTMSSGRTWYETSTIHANAAFHEWYIYDPADLAQVAQGQKQQWEIQANHFTVQYPGIIYPLPGWADWPWKLILGAAYDNTKNQLYIAIRFAGTNNSTRVYVYQVNDLAPSDTQAPIAPTNLSGSATSQTQINLSWNVSIDNIGVSGYKIYRNGVQVGTTNTTNYSDTGLLIGTTYNYQVSAYDAVGNESVRSNQISITTQSSITRYSITDFINLASNWLKTIVSTVDINNDGIVNIKDLGKMMDSWN